jgi:hypothetical protein
VVAKSGEFCGFWVGTTVLFDQSRSSVMLSESASKSTDFLHMASKLTVLLDYRFQNIEGYPRTADAFGMENGMEQISGFTRAQTWPHQSRH